MLLGSMLLRASWLSLAAKLDARQTGSGSWIGSLLAMFPTLGFSLASVTFDGLLAPAWLLPVSFKGVFVSGFAFRKVMTGMFRT